MPVLQNIVEHKFKTRKWLHLMRQALPIAQAEQKILHPNPPFLRQSIHFLRHKENFDGWWILIYDFYNRAFFLTTLIASPPIDPNGARFYRPGGQRMRADVVGQGPGPPQPPRVLA